MRPIGIEGLVDLAEEAVPAAGAAVGGLALVAVAAPVPGTTACPFLHEAEADYYHHHRPDPTVSAPTWT